MAADFLTPAGQWQLNLGIRSASLPAEVCEARAPC
ncbi:hypothetical protein [Pantoea rodasii]